MVVRTEGSPKEVLSETVMGRKSCKNILSPFIKSYTPPPTVLWLENYVPENSNKNRLLGKISEFAQS